VLAHGKTANDARRTAMLGASLVGVK
jgi:hypothetical protein